MDKSLPEKRATIEAVKNLLKSTYLIKYSRHCSINNLKENLIARLTTYFF